MLNTLIEDKVYYKIFDKSFKNLTYIYHPKYSLNDKSISEKIKNNLSFVLSYYKADDIAVLDQVHGNSVINLDYYNNLDQLPSADAMVTTKKNLILSIQTADCVPILLSSSDQKVIGACHCGWKGLRDKIVYKIINVMRAKGADKIKCFIGPSIQQASYEVDLNFYEALTSYNPALQGFFIPHLIKNGFFLFDLPGAVKYQLKLYNIDKNDIIDDMENTYTQPEKYQSYRRSTHLNQDCPGRILSTIYIK